MICVTNDNTTAPQSPTRRPASAGLNLASAARPSPRLPGSAPAVICRPRAEVAHVAEEKTTCGGAKEETLRDWLMGQEEGLLQETFERLIKTQEEVLKTIRDEEVRRRRLFNEKFALEVLVNRLELKCRWKAESQRTTRAALSALESATPYITALSAAIKKRIPQHVSAPEMPQGRRVLGWMGSMVRRAQQDPGYTEVEQDDPSDRFETPLSSEGSVYESDSGSEYSEDEDSEGSERDDSEGKVALVIHARVKLDTTGLSAKESPIAELLVSATANPYSVADKFCATHKLPKGSSAKLAAFLISTESEAESFPVKLEASLTDILGRN